MGGESVGQAEHRRQLRSEQARPQDPDRDVQPLAGNRSDGAAFLPLEIAHQLHDVVGELVLVRSQVAAQRVGGGAVGAGSSAEAEVDPAREQRLESPELLGDHERRMVGQHHPAGADADGRGAGADEGEGDRRGRAGDARHRMMLGHPEAAIAEPLGRLRELERVAQRLAGIGAFGHRGEVED
jgi:hypothetical protein